MRHQRRYVFGAIAQRWHVHGKNIQPVVQIAAKPAGSHIFGEIAIRGRHQTNIHLQCVRAAQPLELSFLQHAQQ